MEAPSKNTTDSKKHSFTNANIINNILMISLNRFYENTENIEKIKKVINGDSNISLRIMDWFVTNYSKKKNICYITYTKTKTLKKFHNCDEESREETKIQPKHKKVQFNVYVRYKAQLKSYSKKNFDPFCRKDRITDWGPDGNITTTMGQLNFFKWAIQNNVLDYIKENLSDIEKDMNSNIRKKKTQTKQKDMNGKKTEKVKRKQLSQNATKLICKMNTETLVEFD
jgi:hypothetical protein